VQAKQSALGKKYAKLSGDAAQEGKSELKLTKGMRDSKEIEMSLMVRASRNLPIILLTNEYKRILERRLQVVGGQPLPLYEEATPWQLPLLNHHNH
jgi:hypothetical protein